MSKKIKNTLYVLTPVLGIILFYFFSVEEQPEKRSVKPDKTLSISSVQGAWKDSVSSKKDTQQLDLILFFELKDFSCPSCVKDFLHFSDYINEHEQEWNEEALYVTTRNNWAYPKQKERLSVWAEANYIAPSFNMMISDTFKDRFDLHKSTLLLKKENGEFAAFYFPLTPDMKAHISKKMKS